MISKYLLQPHAISALKYISNMSNFAYGDSWSSETSWNIPCHYGTSLLHFMINYEIKFSSLLQILRKYSHKRNKNWRYWKTELRRLLIRLWQLVVTCYDVGRRVWTMNQWWRARGRKEKLPKMRKLKDANISILVSFASSGLKKKRKKVNSQEMRRSEQ